MAFAELVVFDLDGTLVDSSRDLCDAVNAALLAEGRMALPDAQIASYIGDGAATLVRRALGAETSEADFGRAYAGFLDHYRLHKLDHTVPYPQVPAALSSIRAEHPGLPMAVLTNKPVNPSREICAALGLAPFFFQNYGGNSFATKKPDPAGLLTLIAEAGQLVGHAVSSENVVMVGDSAVDVRTAQACGARSIGCTYGLAREALLEAAPEILVGSAAEWPQALRQLYS